MKKQQASRAQVRRVAQGIRREQSLERRETDVEARLERKERGSNNVEGREAMCRRGKLSSTRRSR